MFTTAAAKHQSDIIKGANTQEKEIWMISKLLTVTVQIQQHETVIINYL